MKNRIIVLDMLRGIAAIVVTWFHMTNTYSPGFVRNSGQYAWLGLDIFFVVSGFVIPYAMHKSQFEFKKDCGLFMLKRLARIEPPYILAVLLAWGLLYLSSVMPGFQGKKPDISMEHLLFHFAHLNSFFGYSWINPVFWTLAIEFQFYLLISIVYPLITSKNNLLRDGSLLAICSVPFFLDQIIFVSHYICVFAFGILAFLLISKIINTSRFILLSIPVSVSTYFSLGLPVTLIGLVTSLIIIFYRGKSYTLFSFLGTISYSLYLLHIPIGGKIVNLGKRYVDSQFEFFLLSVLATCTSIFCAYYFYKLIEKPSIVLASRIKY